VLVGVGAGALVLVLVLVPVPRTGLAVPKAAVSDQQPCAGNARHFCPE
jgi:hypothetical protein